MSVTSKLVQDFVGGDESNAKSESEVLGSEPWGLAAVAAAVGTYELDGEAHGFPKYRQIHASTTGTSRNSTAAGAASSHCNTSRRSKGNSNMAGVEVVPEGDVMSVGADGSWSDCVQQHEENTLFLYRSIAGRWTVARGPARVKASKGHVVSTLAGGAPVGLDYCYFNGIGGAWPLDPTFAVTADAPEASSPSGPSLRRDNSAGGGLSAEARQPEASRAA